MATKTRYIAVNGENDRTFDKYDQACQWLDKASPETANRGFAIEDGSTDFGVHTSFVRHAEEKATYEIEQVVEGKWFGISTHDTMAEAQAELATLNDDSYYQRFTLRIAEYAR